VTSLKWVGDNHFTSTSLDGGYLDSVTNGLVYMMKASCFHNNKKRGRAYMNRLDVTKQLFHAYINRVQAYNLSQEVGVVEFSNEATVSCPLTRLLETFRQRIDNAATNGATKLWVRASFVCEAESVLIQYFLSPPGFHRAGDSDAS
jgi:hypothetical protein